MLSVFKDLRNWYLLSSIGGGLLIALFMTFAHFSDVMVFIVVLIWALLMGWFFTRKAGSRAKDLSDLRDNCFVNEYISRYMDILEKLKDGTSGASIVRLNLAAGFLDLGDTVSAVRMMQGVDISPRERNKKPIAAIYHNNYSLVFLREGDYENAEKAVQACREVIREGVPEQEKARVEGYCKLREAQIAICRQDVEKFDSAQRIFENYLRGATTPLERSAAAYWLARLWDLKGDKSGEEHYLRIAAESGGDTLYGIESGLILRAAESRTQSVDNREF